MNEQAIKQELITKFGIPEDKVIIQRERRIVAEVPLADFEKIFGYVTQKMGFEILCTITGTDDGANFGVTYHIARTDGTVLSMRVFTPRENPVIKTVTPAFPAATLYERELWDLLGIKSVGLPEGKRYPLPDDWPADEHPLRKDWKSKTPSVPAGTETPAQAAPEEKKNA